MAVWQRRARFVIAVFAVGFAIAVAFAFQKRSGAPAAAPVPLPAANDPGVVVQSTAGSVVRFSKARQDVSVAYDKQITYQDGSTRLVGVKVVTDQRDGRSFTVTGREGRVGQNESAIVLDGDVRLKASDGFTAATEHAEYADADGFVRAAGPVTFSRGRMTGSSVGMTYDKNTDVLSLLDQARLRVAADDSGSGGTDVAAATAIFRRRDHMLEFSRDVKVDRNGQVIRSDAAVAALSEDEKTIQTVQLRGNSSIDTPKAEAGGLQALSGHDMDLKYAANGQALEHAYIVGDAKVQLAGEQGAAGRQISAATLDITLADDGSTPKVVAGQGGVQLAFPPEGDQSARTIRATTLDATGEAGKGLTAAKFNGNVEYKEAATATISARVARSATLDVALNPKSGGIDEARFARGVRFEEGAMAATAANATYVLDGGRLDLGGSEPGAMTPHVVNDQMTVDAVAIDMKLEGPVLTAKGSVKSLLKPAKEDGKGGGTKTPSLLKPDQPTNVTSDTLDYDGNVSKAVYKGNAQLWQVDTTVRGDTIVVDDKSGDLSASGAVTTVYVLEQTNAQTKAKEKVRTIGKSKTFDYQDATRRATYTTGAHLSSPQGDISAVKIELYMKATGADELDHVEAYDDVTLNESGRKTTGTHMTYFSADARYVVNGTPARVVDACGQETEGKTVTFFRSTDLIIVDGQNQMRAHTKATNSKCGS